MKIKKIFSYEHSLYLKQIKKNNIIVWTLRFLILGLLLAIWEIFAQLNIIDSFITSCPSKISKTIVSLFKESDLMYHIGITLYETIIGFLIAVVLGYIIALVLWWSERLRRIFEPYIVVLNSLPKIALGPIIIVWCGSGTKAIIFMTILIGIIVAIITMLNGFLEIDNEKILLLKSIFLTEKAI